MFEKAAICKQFRKKKLNERRTRNILWASFSA